MCTCNSSSKAIALFLSLMMLLPGLPKAFAAEDERPDNEMQTFNGGESSPAYVLMNIPYDKFYEAEVENPVPVDAVSSATKNKPRTGTLAGGSYHENSDGAEINGVTYWVKVEDSAKAWLEQQTRVSDDDSVSITVANRGQTTTTTYTGKEVLFEKASYAYYSLNSGTPPASYKPLTVSDGEPHFGAATGTIQNLNVSSMEIMSGGSGYGDYQITITGTGKNGALSDSVTTVYGVVLSADGQSYGLRHVENIWRQNGLAFSAGHLLKGSHGGCPLAPDHYRALEGKTITGIKYYTDAGIYQISGDVQLKCLPFASENCSVSTTDGRTIQLSNLPDNIADVRVSVSHAEGRQHVEDYAEASLTVAGGSASFALSQPMVRGTTYTVTVSSGNYAAMCVDIAYGSYALMNIPYSEFYAAEVENTVPVDAVSSATLNKPRTGGLVNGSYHTDPKGSGISGVTFPVKLGEGVDLSAYKQVTEDDVVSITVTNRGQTITTEYKGKDALFENADHAYYMLTEVPDYYKEVTVGEDGSLKFGAVTGSVQTVSGAGATLNPVSSYGDYQISITAESLNTDKVYGVKLETSDGGSYGLRHLENIWQGKNLAFCTGFTTSVHGSPTSSGHYTSIMGKTINKIIYYTDGPVIIALNQQTPE